MPVTALARPWLDRSAAALSGLCVLHCALGSLLLLASTPLAWLGAHELHAWGLALVVPLSAAALWRGWRRHAEAAPALLALSGLALMAAGLTTAHGELGEFLLTGLGAGAHAFGHLANIRALAARVD